MTERTIDQTSSVGAAWPPVEASNERLRGFYDSVLRTPEDADVFAAHFEDYRAETDIHGSIDRLSIRAVANLGSVASLNTLGVPLEGAMPIRGEEDLVIVYASWNSPSRRASDEHIAKHTSLLARMTSSPQAGKDRSASLRAKGYTPELIDEFTPDSFKSGLTERFAELYKNFDYTESETEALLLNPTNTIAYIENEEGIISTAMAEKATIHIEGTTPIRIAEITEAFTRPSARGNGLYKDISGYLVHTLLEDAGQSLDVIYGESNLAMPGVVIAAHQNGRRFSHFDAAQLGVHDPGFGILQQNFSVEDGTETRQYNDFALSYVPLG